MTFPGLVASKNLNDATSAESVWDNIGAGISYTINNITTSGVVIKGADILALNGVSRVTARDILLLKGLTSNAQTRLNTVQAQAISGVALQSNALPKTSPVSNGNYSLNGNLAFGSILINGLGAQSLSTAPFSGSTATTSIALDTLIFTSNLQVNNTVGSGTVNSPELAIPIEDNGYIYYLKAGQS